MLGPTVVDCLVGGLPIAAGSSTRQPLERELSRVVAHGTARRPSTSRSSLAAKPAPALQRHLVELLRPVSRTARLRGRLAAPKSPPHSPGTPARRHRRGTPTRCGWASRRGTWTRTRRQGRPRSWCRPWASGTPTTRSGVRPELPVVLEALARTQPPARLKESAATLVRAVDEAANKEIDHRREIASLTHGLALLTRHLGAEDRAVACAQAAASLLKGRLGGRPKRNPCSRCWSGWRTWPLCSPRGTRATRFGWRGRRSDRAEPQQPGEGRAPALAVPAARASPRRGGGGGHSRPDSGATACGRSHPLHFAPGDPAGVGGPRPCLPPGAGTDVAAFLLKQLKRDAVTRIALSHQGDAAGALGAVVRFSTRRRPPGSAPPRPTPFASNSGQPSARRSRRATLRSGCPLGSKIGGLLGSCARRRRTPWRPRWAASRWSPTPRRNPAAVQPVRVLSLLLACAPDMKLTDHAPTLVGQISPWATLAVHAAPPPLPATLLGELLAHPFAVGDGRHGLLHELSARLPEAVRRPVGLRPLRRGAEARPRPGQPSPAARRISLAPVPPGPRIG